MSRIAKSGSLVVSATLIFIFFFAISNIVSRVMMSVSLIVLLHAWKNFGEMVGYSSMKKYTNHFGEPTLLDSSYEVENIKAMKREILYLYKKYSKDKDGKYS